MKKKIKQRHVDAMGVALGIVSSILCSLLMAGVCGLILAICGCSTERVVTVPVETVREHTRTIHTTDTVRVMDSVVIDRAGDTVRIERWRTRWELLTLRDTICNNDTIREPYPVEIEKIVEVEKKLSWWGQVKQEYGGWAIGIIFATVFLILLIKLGKRGMFGKFI